MDFEYIFLDSNEAVQLGPTILNSLSRNTLKGYAYKIKAIKDFIFLGMSNGVLEEKDFVSFATSPLTSSYSNNTWKQFKNAINAYARINNVNVSPSFSMFIDGKIRENIKEHLPATEIREFSKEEVNSILRSIIKGPDQKAKFQSLIAIVLGWYSVARIFDQARLRRRHFRFDETGVKIFFQIRKK